MDCLTPRGSSVCLFYTSRVLEPSCGKDIDESDLTALHKDSETTTARRVSAELKQRSYLTVFRVGGARGAR